ncbi:Hypothetical predicted protein, partial [Pelobates cultripes]
MSSVLVIHKSAAARCYGNLRERSYGIARTEDMLLLDVEIPGPRFTGQPYCATGPP